MALIPPSLDEIKINRERESRFDTLRFLMTERFLVEVRFEPFEGLGEGNQDGSLDHQKMSENSSEASH